MSIVCKFLVDNNLPYYFSLWNTEEFVHQYDLGDDWSDSAVWEYAKSNNLTIITKDSDFSSRILLKDPPPSVIHIRFGNMKMNQFHQVISTLWDDILVMNSKYKLVNVFTDRIEGIN